MQRRIILRGLTGAVLALPYLESLRPRAARAQTAGAPAEDSFAIFFRQACGVAAAQSGPAGDEPERFWPRQPGALTPDNLSGRALDELTAHRDRLLVVGNVNMGDFDYGDGHAAGAMQALTAQGPTVTAAGGDSEAAGESIDHRIGRELNPGGRDSLFLYAGQAGGWLGGACISYRGPANRRAPIHSPFAAYQAITGGAQGSANDAARAELVLRRKSINDLVRGQLRDLLGSPKLASKDRERLDLHLTSIRDLELALTCSLRDDAAKVLEGEAQGFDSTNGDEVLRNARLHLDVAVLAVACGHTRSVALQIGNGNDAATRYVDPDTGSQMENYHYISHRRLSHDNSGGVIANADLLHHKIDRQFAKTFAHLLDRLASYPTPTGTLLDQGLSVWYNDNANGPAHSHKNVPFVLAGSASGFLKQGLYVTASGGREINHSKLLNTIGSAVGVRTAAGAMLEDFGDPSMPRGLLPELMA